MVAGCRIPAPAKLIRSAVPWSSLSIFVAPGQCRGSPVITPSTSFHTTRRSAPQASANNAPLKSEPSRPKVVGRRWRPLLQSLGSPPIPTDADMATSHRIAGSWQFDLCRAVRCVGPNEFPRRQPLAARHTQSAPDGHGQCAWTGARQNPRWHHSLLRLPSPSRSRTSATDRKFGHIRCGAGPPEATNPSPHWCESPAHCSTACLHSPPSGRPLHTFSKALVDLAIALTTTTG